MLKLKEFFFCTANPWGGRRRAGVWRLAIQSMERQMTLTMISFLIRKELRRGLQKLVPLQRPADMLVTMRRQTGRPTGFRSENLRSSEKGAGIFTSPNCLSSSVGSDLRLLDRWRVS